MNRHRTLKMVSLALFPLLLGAGCARMGAPPGGPVDEEPPTVVEVAPEPGSTEVDTTVEVEVRFSEPVRQQSLASSFSVSPPPPGAVHADWRGREVRFRFDPPLRDNRTYVITLGTQLKDRRNNSLEEAVSLAFSTGPVLDKAWLAGKLVVEGEATGWNVVGYRLAEADTTGPDPSVDVPQAATQASADGAWVLRNLREGRWRIFAFQDSDNDRLWTPWSEPLGVPPYDVEAREDSLFVPRPVTLVPVMQPQRPAISRATALVRNRVNVRFARKPARPEGTFRFVAPPDTFQPPDEEAVFLPADTLVTVLSADYRTEDSTTVRLQLDRNLAGDFAWLSVRGAFGTPDTLDTALVLSLANASAVDSFPPGLVGVRPEAGSRIHRGAEEVEFHFSEPMEYRSPGVTLSSPTGDTLSPTGTWRGPARFRLDLGSYQQGGALTVRMVGDSLRDLAGNTVQDSLLRFDFAYLPPDSLGMISGTVQGMTERGEIHLRLLPLRPSGIALRARVGGSGPFRFEDVPAGRWTMTAWQDVDRNGRWSEGRPLPFQPSDPFLVVPDTFQVRARWELGGERVVFPE